MAPFGKAIRVSYNGPSDAYEKVYRGHVDPDWAGKGAPHGGYVLALVLEACIQYQASTSHRDPIHVTAHFLRATSIAPFQVQVRTLRKGKGFTNVLADLIQQDLTRISAHLIFGTLENPRLLVPPSSYARRLPMYVHPSIAVETPPRRFAGHIKSANDPHLRAQNLPDSPARTTSTTVGGGGLVWGSWIEFIDPSERITPAFIAFLVDIFLNLPANLPRSERQGVYPQKTWFATMTMSIEFKAPIPPPSKIHAARTVGLYSSGTFWGDPQGRHDAYAEVWTAPSNVGEGTEKDGWRDNQFCLATATQMALTLPVEESDGHAKYDAPKTRL